MGTPARKAMTRLAWRLVHLLSRLVEPGDREAVLGDWIESGAPAGRILLEMAGFVLHQQASHWMDWRPWLAVIFVVLPIGIVLSHVARWWADGSAIYLYLYVSNWTWGYWEVLEPAATSSRQSRRTRSNA